MLNADGSPFGAAIPLSREPQYEYSPSVAYDPVQRRHLVTWTDDYTTNIHGRVVNPDGALPGLASPITNAPGWQYSAFVVSDTVNGRFLVTWEDRRNVNQTDIYGILLAGLPVMPMLSLQLNTQTVRAGDPFRLKARIQTPLQAPPGGGKWKFEAAVWVKTPMPFPDNLISLVNLGGPQALELPPGFDQDFTLLDFSSFPPVPTGFYEIGGRLNHSQTREEFILDRKRLEVVPLP